jgi:hypothetical protein
MHRCFCSATKLRLAALILATSTLAFAGSFLAPVNYTVNPYPTGIVTGDFNRDGNTDLAMTVCGDLNCATTGSVQLLLGQGDGTFILGNVFIAGPFGTTADTMASGDFNGDGTPDLVVVNNGINKFGDVSVLIADGNGGFLPPVSYPVIGSTPVWVAVADFNGDHKLDLAVSVTTTNSVSILLGNGDGTFQPAVSYAVESSPQGITVGDLNGDGHPDVVAANQCGVDPTCRQGTISVLLGNGDGTFQKELSFNGGLSPLSVTVADFNGDGHLDVAVADACGTDPKCVSNGSVGVLLGNGDGTLQPLVSYPATAGATVRLTVGDFNGDHHPDVVALSSQTPNITVFLGNGDGTLAPGTNYVTSLVPIWVVVGDFNRDHAQDLAIVNEFSSDVSLLLNGGGTHVALTSAPNPSHAHQAVTFTATVTATAPGLPTPTGSVTFVSGKKILGTAQVAAGVATLVRSNLPVGQHPIRANYSGDSQYNPNFSSPITQTVQP